MARIGHKRSLAETLRKVRLGIRKATIVPVAAAQNEFFVGYIGFAI